MTRPIPNAPDGVRRSPSRLAGETPRCPTHAVHGPRTRRQQSPAFRQSSSRACVDARVGATTVISCAAEPVVESRFATVGGHAPARSRLASAGPGATSASRAATAIVLLIWPCRLRWAGDEAPVDRASGGQLRSGAAGDIRRVFARLYAARFPIRRMRVVDVYGGSDPRSMAADNTSAFNCRYASAPA